MRVRPFVAAALAAFALFAASPSQAEAREVRISKGFGILYLPLFVMEDQKLLEKHAAKAGLGEGKTSWPIVDGGNLINDAMMTGNLDFAGIGGARHRQSGSDRRQRPQRHLAVAQHQQPEDRVAEGFHGQRPHRRAGHQDIAVRGGAADDGRQGIRPRQFREADAFIARDKPGAAATSARMAKVKVSEAEVVEMLKDPDTRFSTMPVSVMDFANFLQLAGTTKTKPANSKELFVAPLHGRQGS